ncbi:MAG: AbrB family transcriptional regulator [Pseudomonadota bacterium]|jgi:antitoxin ChpS|nr:AbrB family transcriptional regulator [Pseudomonadota bacterium]|tara:strand:- start:37 stop:294 length:258 start_codon:yes stop_codon:yes gene_type:complete
MQTTICKLGNSKGIIIPDFIVRELNLAINQRMAIKNEAGSIILEPFYKQRYSLDELLSQCSSKVIEQDEENKLWLNGPNSGDKFY